MFQIGKMLTDQLHGRSAHSTITGVSRDLVTNFDRRRFCKPHAVIRDAVLDIETGWGPAAIGHVRCLSRITVPDPLDAAVRN